MGDQQDEMTEEDIVAILQTISEEDFRSVLKDSESEEIFLVSVSLLKMSRLLL
jgi:hypothetical protein